MNNSYKIDLGISLNQGDLGKIKTQLNNFQNQKKINLEINRKKIDSQLNSIRKQIQNLSNIKIDLGKNGGNNSLSFNTEGLNASLKEVAASIKVIKNALGTLDDGGEMKSLLVSVNQISTALDKASGQFSELNTQLNALSKKDFSVNIGVKLGGSNSVNNNIEASDVIRNQVIPELQKQEKALAQYLAKYYNTNEFNAINKLLSKTGNDIGGVAGVINTLDKFNQPIKKGELNQRMQDLRNYINLIKQAAATEGIDLTPVVSKFNGQADDMVKHVNDIKNGAKQAEDGFEKLKSVLGSSVDGERLSSQLDSIVADLNEIKTAIQGLSQNASLGELTTSFNNLSSSLEKLVGNATQAQNVLNNGLNASGVSGASADTQRVIQEQNELAQTTARTADAVFQSGQKIHQAFNQMAAASGLDPVEFNDDITEANELELAITRLKQVMTGIGKIQVGQISTAKGVTELQTLENQLESLSAEYNETVAEINGLGGMTSKPMQQMRGQMESAVLKIDQLKARIVDVKTELSGKIQGNFGNYEAGFVKLQNRINALATKTPELQTQLEGIRQRLEALKSADGYERLKASNDSYLSAVKLLEAELTKLEAMEKGDNSSIALQQQKKDALLQLKGLFESNSEAARKFGSRVQELEARINACGSSAGFTQIKKDIGMLKTEIKQANVETQTFGSQLKKQFAKYSSYFSVASLFMYAEQGLRSMFEQVKLIDSAMTELKKVTDETDASYNQFLENAASRAKELGTTIDGLVESTADFARLGYGFEDAQGLAEVANIYAVVGDEIEGVEGATKSLISTMAAFKEQAGGISDADFAMSIVDKFNEVSNNYSISSGGIGEALQRSASSLAAANNTLDESIALTTAANEVTQDPAVVGNAMKTISMRIRGAKTEMEALGEDTSGMVESTAKLRSEILALSGVDIMLDDNTFKSTYQIMDELAQKWESLTDIQQASITELVAGKRQGNIMSSLMQNFDVARESLQTSLKSTGSAMAEHEKWQQSLEARINSLKASWQSLSQTFMNSNFLKWGIDATTKFIDVIDTLIDRFGILGTTVGGIGLYKTFKNGFALDNNGNQIGAYFNILNGFKGLGSDLTYGAGSLIKETITSSDTLGNKLRNIGQIGKMAGQDISQSFNKSKDSLGTMAKDIAKIVVIMNAIKAVQDIIDWISEAGDEAETSAEKFDRISSELSDADSELRSLESELSSVESQINTLLAKDELTFADEEELARLQSISSELERQIELTKTLQESLQQSLNTTSISAYNEYSRDTSFYSKESKEDREKEAKSMGTSIGNIAGLIIGGVIGGFAGGNVLLGAAIGSSVGSLGGGLAGGVISNASYDAELTVGEAIDNMRFERAKLNKALDEAKEAYANDPTDANRQAYEEAAQALSDYNATLSEHINQLANYYNSIDYSSLTTDKQREDYLKMGDDLDKYNIEMGVSGAKSTALDRIFSDELITEEAEGLRSAVEAAFNSGRDFNFTDFDGKEFDAIRERLADIGITITDVIGYFEELKEAQAEASDYETYDIVNNIAALQEGVTLLTDAFKEFNEEGIVTAETLVALHELFGGLGDDWSDYVNAVTSGTSSIEEVREATEKLAEAHLNDVFSNGGIKFNKFNEETGKYEYDADKYLTYLSTINQLEHIGVQNAKEYVDALQQQKMVQEAVNKMRADASERNILIEKESLNKDETERLNELNNKLAKGTSDYISSVEKEYGLSIIDSTLVQKQADLEEYQKKAKQYEKWLSKIEKFDFEGSKELQDNYSKSMGSLSVSAIDAEIDRLYDALWKPITGSDSLIPINRSVTESIRDLFGADDTIYDQIEELEQRKSDIFANQTNVDAEVEKRQKMFDDLKDIAKEAEIDLSDIDIGAFDVNDISEDSIFNQVYERVTTGLEDANWGELADGLEAEIESGFDNLGLDIDFGRYFDKIIIDGLKTDLEALNTAMAEAVSGSGLSTDSIIAIEEIFGDLNSYDASSLFEHTANGIRLNADEFRKLNDEFKSSNVDGIKDKLSALGDEYNKTREELSDLKYGTDEYNSTISKLEGLEEQIKMTEEYASSLEGLFSAYQNWQRAEASGSQRDMYEGMIGGFENMDDEISRGWLDDGTIEFLRLIKGENISATATTKELMKAYKSLDDTIEHTGYSIRDFFTVDEDGNSTNTGVYNFLDAIGQMEEEKFGGKDVVQRENGEIIGFDFKVAGGDQAIADALGISKELVQIMVRAADDAGFVISMDGTYQQLDILKEKASEAATKLKDTFGKTEHEFFQDGSKTGVLKDYEEALKVWETYSKNKNADGTVNMEVEGAEEAFTLVSTLQSMVDKLSEPIYMELDASEVDKDMQTPLSKLQEYERLVKQENQLKLKGTDTSEIDAAQKEIVDYLNELSPEIKADLGIENDSWEEIQRKVESGEIEIPATVDLQVEMNDTLRDMVNVALYNAGVIDKEELTKRVDIELYADKVDASDVEDKTEDAVDNAVDDSTSREQNIKIVAETFGVKDVEGLKNAMSGLTDEQVKAIAEAIGKGDVDALDSAVDGMADNTVQAVAQALGYNDVESLKSAINNMQGKEVPAAVNTDGQSTKIDTLQSSIFGLKGTTVDVVVNFIKSGWNAVKEWVGNVASGGKKKAAQRTGGGTVNGTANVNGTTGRAFKQGNWGTKNSGTALVGELGTEVLVRDGRYYTIGDNGAEFIKYKKGDIILNHVQSEQLFKNGKVTAGGGRAKAFVDGTAFAGGSSGIGGIGKVKASSKKKKEKKKSETTTKTTTKKTKDTTTTTTTTTTKTSKAKNSGSSSSSSGSSGSGGTGKVEGSAVGDDFEETFDWIQVAIERIEREIDNLDQTVGNVYKSWGDRNTALASEIAKVGEEITLQNNAASEYLSKANAVGLDESWAAKVRNGTLDINTVTDEDTAEKIKEYQKWYELYLDCIDKAEELKETESELYAQRFENVQSQYDGILQGYEHTEAMLNEYISQAEEQGHIVSKKYYQALIDNEKNNIAELQKEQSDLIAKRDEAVASGAIVKGSQAWYDMCAEIDGVTQAIEEGTTALIEYDNAMRDIDWEVFDLIQERISDVADEANFLIDLMSYDKLFDDNGKLTDKGMATMGLHGQNYNTYMYAADEYAKEVAKLDAQIAETPYDQELINRRNELLELQRESILAAEDEKQAIVNLVEEGINLELDALQELIDKKNEELESEKDLYNYSKKVKEQTEEIASLEKELAAYSGDNSEEARAKVQELKVSLEEAKTNLEETEYDKYLSDTQQMLDTLYDEYELTLNARLDNLDYLVQGVIDAVNIAAGVDGTLTTALSAEGAIATALGTNANTIKTTLENEAKNVGATLSTAMSNIWNAEGSGNKVITMYGEGFQQQQTTTNTVLNSIKANIDRMVDDVDKDATRKVNANKTTTSAKKNPTTTKKTTATKKTSSSGDGKPKIGDKVKYVSGQYYYDSQGKKPLGSHKKGEYVYITNINTRDWATHGYHISTGKKLGQGDLGWLKLNQLSGYATGKKNFLDNEIAWTQENGKEFIIRPSDGAILTPIAKGDSVLTSAASSNIWDMANSPAEFIKDNLNLGVANAPNNSNVQNNCVQNFEKIVFSMPNVKNYGELLLELQKDPKFDKLIKAMTIDQIAGKSSLVKNKSIR